MKGVAAIKPSVYRIDRPVVPTCALPKNPSVHENGATSSGYAGVNCHLSLPKTSSPSCPSPKSHPCQKYCDSVIAFVNISNIATTTGELKQESSTERPDPFGSSP